MRKNIKSQKGTSTIRMIIGILAVIAIGVLIYLFWFRTDVLGG